MRPHSFTRTAAAVLAAEQSPDGAVVERRTGLRVNGKENALEAYLLFALP
jgi:hypothetical protein